MPYDESAAGRVRKALSRRRGITERKMFGGLAFFHRGNMCCGVLGDDLVLRLGAKGAERALEASSTREMDFTGTPLESMVYVAARGYRTDEALRDWIRKAIDFTSTLPPK